MIDEGWYLQNPEYNGTRQLHYAIDQNGRHIPAINCFPSAADGVGFKSLAEWVHSLGLKFGIHLIRGIPREAVAKNLPIAGSPFMRQMRPTPQTSASGAQKSENLTTGISITMA